MYNGQVFLCAYKLNIFNFLQLLLSCEKKFTWKVSNTAIDYAILFGG